MHVKISQEGRRILANSAVADEVVAFIQKNRAQLQKNSKEFTDVKGSGVKIRIVGSASDAFPSKKG